MVRPFRNGVGLRPTSATWATKVQSNLTNCVGRLVLCPLPFL